jgi:dolichol-phosphate mannosyltransferase
VCDVPIPAIYGEETSSLRIGRVLRTFPSRLGKALIRRIWSRHFIREFGPVGLFLSSGGLLMIWATLFGAWNWACSSLSGVPATSGTVMLSALPFLMGFQLLLQALVMDITMPPERAALKAMRSPAAAVPAFDTAVPIEDLYEGPFVAGADDYAHSDRAAA